MSKISLPIDRSLPEIVTSLGRHPHLVLTAAPGAGKTTRLPPALLQACTGKILVLEPRRMAAIAAASRIAEENGWVAGQEVGWQVRFENKTSADTRLVFLTEALLARKMIQDPELSGVDIVILDEFHERSLHSDVTLGLLRELVEMGRELKIVVMSATLTAERISKYLFDAPVMEIPGQLHELEIEHQREPQRLATGPEFIDRIVDAVRDVTATGSRDTLVFLPGTGEINRAHERLNSASWAKDFDILPLHGSLPLQEQRRALQAGDRRRVILSTNVAESSVTVDGVDRVIDSGLARKSRFDSRTGFSRLELGRISLNSAIQRAGRSARQFPGKCLRLWSKHDEHSMTKDEIPEIQRGDLSEALLLLSRQGVRDFAQFPWFEAPPAALLKAATDSLRLLGALDHDNALTEEGHAILRYPTAPRVALLLREGARKGDQQRVAKAAAILQERDFLDEQQAKSHLGESWECDLHLRLSLMDRWAPKTTKAAAEQFSRLASRDEARQISKPDEDLREVLMTAFADRLCRRRGGGERARMVGGRGVKLGPGSVVRKSEFFLALNGREVEGDSDTRIEWACGLEKEFVLQALADRIEKREEPVVDEERGKVYLETARYFGDLALEEPSRKIADAETVARHLPRLCQARFTELRKKNEALDRWIERWDFLRAKTDESLPSLSEGEAQLRALEQACFGETSLEAVAAKDLVFFFETEAGPEAQRLRRELPDALTVPSGRSHRVFYPADRDPYMEVRLQEVFGWKQNPAVLGGKIPVILHLLAPNHRPVQVTGDLASFWSSGYIEVRKELRARYPKHSWPDDPTTAQATHRTKPRV